MAATTAITDSSSDLAVVVLITGHIAFGDGDRDALVGTSAGLLTDIVAIDTQLHIHNFVLGQLRGQVCAIEALTKCVKTQLNDVRRSANTDNTEVTGVSLTEKCFDCVVRKQLGTGHGDCATDQVQVIVQVVNSDRLVLGELRNGDFLGSINQHVNSVKAGDLRGAGDAGRFCNVSAGSAPSNVSKRDCHFSMNVLLSRESSDGFGQHHL
jgi:hypothetical protein